jgi:hypothetical protein
MQYIKRLQKALAARGKIYKINTNQFYSNDQKRFILSYRVTEKQVIEKPDGQKVAKDIELIKTCSVPELLKWFAKEWNELNES